MHGTEQRQEGRNADISAPAAAAAAAPDAAEMNACPDAVFDAVFDTRFRLKTQRAYALDRAQSLERTSTAVALLGVLSGATVIADMAAIPIGKAAVGALVAILSVLELGFGFSRRASQWRSVVDRCDSLDTQLRLNGEASAVARCNQALDEITTPAEPLYVVVQKLAWNTALRELGGDAPPIVVGKKARLLRNIFAGDPDS